MQGSLRVSVLSIHTTTGRTGPGLRESLTSCWISTTVPEWARNQVSAYTDMSILIEERSPVWSLDESSWGKWTHVAVEFTHLHAYPLTVLRKRNKNVWTAHRFLVLQDESPDNSLINMYINPDLTAMSKTTCMWGKKTKNGEMKQPKWAIRADSSSSPLLDLPNVAPLSKPDRCVTLVDTI